MVNQLNNRHQKCSRWAHDSQQVARMCGGRYAVNQLWRIKLNQEYEFSSDKKIMDVDAIHSYLSRSYWAENVPHDIVSKAIENSLCFGVFYNKSQIGFARLITDSATFAYLADVYILEEHRGKGLSKKLMETIIAHPQLQGLRRMVLATYDAHTLYEKFGFKQLAKPQTFMELWKPEVYKTA